MEDAGAKLDGVPVHINIAKALDGFAFTAAVLLESAPELSTTPKTIRANAETIAGRVKDYVKMLKLLTEQNGGVTMLESLRGQGSAFDADPAVVRAINEQIHDGVKPN